MVMVLRGLSLNEGYAGERLKQLLSGRRTRSFQLPPLMANIATFRRSYRSEGRKYTPKAFSALKTQVLQQAKKRFGVYQNAGFSKGKRRKIHIHQRAFKVFVGNHLAHYWCIDFGLL